MSAFFDAMGEDAEQIERRAGVRSSTSSATSSTAGDTGVYWIPISRYDMLRIETFYSYQEPEIDNTNDIKNYHSMASGSVKFYYGGELLDDKDYCIEDTMRRLMMKARDGYQKFGFFAVRNPDARADRILVELQNETTDSSRSTPDAIGTPFEILDNALTLIDELESQTLDSNPDIVDKADAIRLGRRLKRLHNDIALSLGGADDNNDDDDDNDNDLKKRRRIRPTRRLVDIQTMPRTSWLKSPDAALRITAVAPKNNVNSRLASSSSSSALTLFSPHPERSTQRERGMTLNDAIVGLNNLQPVEINEGQFYLEVDELTNNRRVVFSRKIAEGSEFDLSHFKHGNRSAVNAARLRARENLKPVRELEIDEEVTVYVFSGHMPIGGKIRTKMETVMRHYDALNQAERNAAAVDYRNAHPIQIVQHIPTPYKKDAERMTDQELYGGQESIEEEHQRRIDDAQQAVMTYALAVQAQLQNNKRRDDLAKAIAEFAVAPVNLDAEGNPVPPRIERDDYFLLPAGCQTTSGVVATTTIDPNMVEHRYKTALANALGIPLQYLNGGTGYTGRASKGGTGTSGSVSTSATAEIGHSRLRETISSDRDRLKEFVNGLWDAMYRHYDNKTLQNILSNETTLTRKKAEYKWAFIRRLMHRLAVVTEVSERRTVYDTIRQERHSIVALKVRMAEIVRRIREISSMRHRFEVRFENLSFLSQAELQSAVMIGALTPMEAANAIRVGIGLPPFTEEEFQANEDAKLEKSNKELESQAKIQAKYQVKKTPGGGSGGGGGKSGPSKKTS